MMGQGVVAFVQARMASARFPGKVLADIEGKPMLVRVVERARRATTVDQVVVTTSWGALDDPIAKLCETRNWKAHRGSGLDVLDRTYQAARAHAAQVVVRLTADCPLIDPGLIDQTVLAYFEAQPPVDFAANRLPTDKTYPVGTDTEVCSFGALDRAWSEAKEPHQREHVMPYIYEQPGRFRTLIVRADRDYSQFRWTVDTPEDLELVRSVYARFDGRDDFAWTEVLELFSRDQDLASLNAEVRQKTELDVDPGWSS